MIKLNNKNITYVALADSSSSIKVPKEIWYADTNNSVKLVYRRKDALIEGEDYEKYHFMRVVVNDTSSSSVTIYLPINSSTFNYTSIIEKGKNIGHLDTNGYWYYTLDATNKDIRVWDKTNGMTTENTNVGSNVMVFNSNSNEFTVNNIQITKYGFPVKGKLFYCKGELNGSILTSPISVNGSIKYVPVKLLKPVPKWLDANGIRRNVGDCGMIDIETGKFRGATNDYGTISVVNYYERKEWLVGDGSAYIDTNVIVNSSTLKLELQYRLGNESYQPIFGSRDNVQYESQNTVLWVTDYTKFRLDLLSEGSSVQHCNALDINSIEFDATVPKVTINGNEFTSNKSFTNSVNTFRIFDLYLRDATYKYADGSMSYFKLNDGTNKLDLIPCTLTMDLPASMDANNIARTKGTSGMWDLVSDRFYGNVANSGTFKAVNLAEGVDYEVHQWLVANIPIGVTMMRLFINQSSSVNYTMNITTTSNSIPLFRTAVNGNKEDYVYFNSKSKLYVWSYITGTNESVSAIYSNNGLYNIELSPSEFIINSVSATKYGDAYTIVWHNNPNSTNAGVTSTSKITIDGVDRYIPVKLLHSIPAKYDANGIARQIGECGMYDTVNDVFYGNVASSGTFSVSDDS